MLEKKKELFKPLDPEKLREHQQKHDEMMKMKKLEAQLLENEIIARQQSYVPQKSKFTDVILQEEREKKEKKFKLQEEKKSILEKRNKYGELVKEVFKPRVK